MTRTMEIGQTSTAYDPNVLEEEGRLQFHLTFNFNPSPSRDHPLVVLYPTAKQHFHAFLLAALKVSDCCHKESTLLTKVANFMSSGYHTADFHKGVCAAAILLGNVSISGFPVRVVVGVVLLSADEVEELVASSDDGVLASTSEDSDDTRPPWQTRNMHFDCVPCFASSVSLEATFLLAITMWAHC